MLPWCLGQQWSGRSEWMLFLLQALWSQSLALVSLCLASGAQREPTQSSATPPIPHIAHSRFEFVSFTPHSVDPNTRFKHTLPAPAATTTTTTTTPQSMALRRELAFTAIRGFVGVVAAGATYNALSRKHHGACVWRPQFAYSSDTALGANGAPVSAYDNRMRDDPRTAPSSCKHRQHHHCHRHKHQPQANHKSEPESSTTGSAA